MLVEDEQLLGFERSAPRIFVDLDITDRLPYELEVIWEGGTSIQNLDYWKIAFRCHLYRLIGHSKESFPMHFLS